MISLSNYPYTKQKIIDVLHGKYGARHFKFRYDLLDKNEMKIGELDSVVEGEVSMSALAQIKRTAKFLIKDTGDINWLSDRIQPFVEVKIPEIKRKHDDYTLGFDGVDDYVNIPNSPSINFNASFSILFKVKILTLPSSGEENFIDKNGYTHYRIGLKTDGSIHTTIQTTDGTNSTYDNGYGTNFYPNLNQWYEIAYVFDSENKKIKLFVNGELWSSRNSTYNLLVTSSSPLRFARYSNSYANCELNYVNFWNRALTQQEIQDNMNKRLTGNENGLVGLWRFDEGTGNIAKDSTQNGNHGTIYGAKWKKNGIEIETIPSKYIEFPLGIFLLSSPTRRDENNSIYREVEAYDGTVILRDDKFQSRYFIEVGTNYRNAVIDILLSAGITKHNIEQTDKVLPKSIEFEPGKEKLEAVNELLTAINFTPIHVDVYGYFTSRIYSSPSVRSAEYTYKDDELSIIVPGMEEELDLFNVANKWVAVLSDPELEPLTSVYTNESESSPTSTVNRGRTIVDYRQVDNIADQQSLDSYVQRIAFESSQIYGKLVFETAINPLHDYFDVLNIEYSKLGINGKYSETGWSLPLRIGATMKHECRKVISI